MNTDMTRASDYLPPDVCPNCGEYLASNGDCHSITCTNNSIREYTLRYQLEDSQGGKYNEVAKIRAATSDDAIRQLDKTVPARYGLMLLSVAPRD